MLLAHLIKKPLAIRRDVPRIRPETEIDAPPFVGHAGLIQGGKQHVEVELAGAERIVRAGVVFVVLAVDVDQMDVSDFAL